MDDKAGTGDGDPGIPDRLNMKVAGPAIAAGAVSLGLVLIGACGIGHKDVYVAPPPLAADLQVASTPIKRSSGTTTPQVAIPPSPSWRVAADTPPRRTTSTATSGTTTTESTPGYSPYAPYTPPTTTEPTTTGPTTTTTDPYYRGDPYDDTTTTPPRHTQHSVEESDSDRPYYAPTTEPEPGEDN